MNKKLLLTAFTLTAGLQCSWGACTSQMVEDFENGTNKMGDGWDLKAEIVANPAADATNSSANCLKATFSETWGTIARFDNTNYATYGLTFLVYLEEPGEVSVRAYDAAKDENYSKSFTIFEAKKWVRASFDFSKECATSNSIQISTGSKNTIYIDDVKLVCLDDMEQSGPVCGEMEVPYTYGNVAIGGGGFISGIIAQGNTKIARTDVGGFYKWNASNCSWKQLTPFISEDDKGFYSVESVTIDPQNENNIYAITGCQYFSDARTAILYSKDGGKSFSTVNVSKYIRVHGNGVGRNCGERIAVDPNNSNIILCGGRAGSPLIMSTDGGENWSPVSTFPTTLYNKNINWPSWTSNAVNTTDDENGVTAVVFDGSQKTAGKTSRIFVGVSSKKGANVYVSEDGGSTWSAVSSLPSNLIPCRMKMDPDGNLLIAYSITCFGNDNGKYDGAIYRYNPNTKTAVDISPAKGYCYGDVAVSTKDANKLVAASVTTWKPQQWDNGSTPFGDIFWSSTDGGKTWRSYASTTDANGNLIESFYTITNNNVTWVPGFAIHWVGSICMDPNDDNKVSFASGNGIFTCNNIFCDKKPTFYFDVNGLEETVPLDMVSIPNGDLLSVIGDYTGFIHNDINTFAPIHNPAPGTSGGINYYSKDPNVRMRVSNAQKCDTCSTTPAFMYTTEGNKGWTEMVKTDFQYINPYYTAGTPLYANEGKCAITKKDGTFRFFVIPGPGESGLYYSDNFGKSWTKVAGTDKATHVQVDPENDKYVYLGGKSTFYMSSNYGEDFTAQNFPNGDYGRITIVPDHEGLIYAPCAGSGLKVSTNYGSTWNAVPYVTYCEAVGCGKGETADSYAIYLWGKANGCETGLYRSIDNGKSWQRINDTNNQFGGPGNGQFVIGDWNKFGRFYMSSIGLGIIYGDLAENAKASQWSCFEDNTECKIATEVNESIADATSVYPNPFSSDFSINETGNYVVNNITGDVVENGVANEGAKLGANWPTGFYFVTINGKTFKVVKR